MSYMYSILNSISSFLSNFFEIFGTKRDSRILMIGLDNAGKTTLLYKLKLGELITSQPTIGFNVEQIRYKNITFTIYDVGGQEKNRYLWNSYVIGSHAVIFIIDSNDKERFNQVKKEIHQLHSELPSNIAFLLFANKQDIETSLTELQLCETLDLNSLTNRKWAIYPTSAIKDEDEMGVDVGFEWLKHNIVW